MKRFNSIKKTISIGMVLATVFTMSTTAFAAPVSSADIPVEDVSYQQISQDMVLEIMNQYVAESSANINSIMAEEDAVSFIDGFVQYAVDNGYIADTPEQRASLSVFAVRALLSLAANAGGTVWYTAGTFLEHSLNDHPTDIIAGPSSSYAEQIQESSEFQDILDDAKSLARGLDDNVSVYRTSGSTTLDSTTDLLLAYRAIRYNIRMERDHSNDNLWHLEVTFKDTYDFDSDGWISIWEEYQTGSFIGAAAEALNAAAEAAMDIGAIVEYDIEVTVETSFSV